MKLVRGVLPAALLVAACAAAPAAGPRRPLVVNVPGTANPWLAGMPRGAGTSSGDRVPNNAPVAIALAPGRVQALTFATSGGVQHHPYDPPRPAAPDGGIVITHVPENSLSGLTAPVNALVGVFLAGEPVTTQPPEPVDFARTGWNFTVLAPRLRQPFFIGSGAATVRDGSGRRQRVPRRYLVPAGATLLLLGVMDEYEWKNNSGWLRVLIEAEGSAAAADMFVVDTTITYPAQQ